MIPLTVNPSLVKPSSIQAEVDSDASNEILESDSEKLSQDLSLIGVRSDSVRRSGRDWKMIACKSLMITGLALATLSALGIIFSLAFSAFIAKSALLGSLFSIKTFLLNTICGVAISSLGLRFMPKDYYEKIEIQQTLKPKVVNADSDSDSDSEVPVLKEKPALRRSARLRKAS